MQFTCAKNRITAGHSNVTSKNVSWYHFSWATLYVLALLSYEVSAVVKDMRYFVVDGLIS